MHAVIEKIQRIFNERGTNQYGTEAVTQLEHALQNAELAEASSAPQSLVIASMLHDIGHIFHTVFKAMDIDPSTTEYHNNGQPLPIAHDDYGPIKELLA